MSSHRFLLRRVWHLAIPTPPAMGSSSTEYAEFTEPPTEMSSRRFLLRRVWHLAIPTPLAMGYSPTEYAEFTEPPAEMSSHGWHGSTQIVRCAVLPQNSQNSQNLAAWVWQGCHTLLHLCASVPSVEVLSLQEVLCILCIPWESLSSHGWHGSTQIVRCAVLPQNSQNTQNLAAWVWQGCHTLLICAHPCHLWEALLCKRFCVFGVFRGSFFTACSVGAAETAAPTGVIHGSSAHISPSHHLTTTTPFHLEPSLLHVLPVLWVRLRHHLRLVDAQPGEHDCRRCERHRHAVVVVGVDRL